MSFHPRLSKHKKWFTLWFNLSCLLGGIALLFQELWLWLGAFAIQNLYALWCTYRDKRLAVGQSTFRIPEKTLYYLAAAGGGIGTLAGLMLFRHKTKHRKLMLVVLFLCCLSVALFILGLLWIESYL